MCKNTFDNKAIENYLLNLIREKKLNIINTNKENLYEGNFFWLICPTDLSDKNCLIKNINNTEIIEDIYFNSVRIKLVKIKND